MKIGIVLDDSLDPPDGVQQYVLTLGNWLVQQGHTVHYLVGQTSRTDIANIKSLSRNIAVRFNGNMMRIPLPASKRSIKTLLLTEQYDVLHVQMPYSPFLAQRIISAADTSTAVIGTFHIVAYSKLVTIANVLLGFWLRRSLRRFDAVMAVSEPAAALAQSAYHLTAHIVPNLVATKRFMITAHRSQPITIAYLGRLVPRKGVQVLLEAVKLLQQRPGLPPFITTIGGRGALLPALKQYVTDNTLQNVTFTGFVDEAHKPKFLAEADISVFPSRGGESFGIILVEAMTNGNSVVLAGNNSGYRTVLREYPSLLFSPTDSQALADTLAYWITHPKQIGKTATALAATAQTYDEDIVGPQILEQYARCLRQRQSLGHN